MYRLLFAHFVLDYWPHGKTLRCKLGYFGGHKIYPWRPIHIRNPLREKPANTVSTAYSQLTIPRSRYRSIRRTNHCALHSLQVPAGRYSAFDIKAFCPNYVPRLTIFEDHCLLLPLRVGFNHSSKHVRFDVPFHIPRTQFHLSIAQSKHHLSHHHSIVQQHVDTQRKQR